MKFRAEINEVRLFERDDGRYSIMNRRLSGGLSVQFSKQELAALQFMVDQAVSDIGRREMVALEEKEASDDA